ENVVEVSADGLLQSTSRDVDAQADHPKSRKRVAYHPTRVLVKFKHGKAPDFLPGSGRVKGFAGDTDLFVVDNPPGVAVPKAVRHYAKHPDVLYSEPDYLVHSLDTIPSDPRWSDQWDMVQIGAPSSWDSQTDAGDVVVGVIDTGIDFTHPD